MNKLSKFVLGAALCGASAAFAAEVEGDYSPYVKIGGGIAITGKDKETKQKHKAGAIGQIELGVSYDNWRFGLEGSFSKNKVKNPEAVVGTTYSADLGQVTDAAGTALIAHGCRRTDTSVTIKDINSLNLMANVTYDYALTEEFFLYAGLGLGVAKVSRTYDVKKAYATHFSGVDYAAAKTAAENDQAATLSHGSRFTTPTTTSKVGSTVFAWQLMAGFGYDIDANWSATVGYKLFSTAKVKTFTNDGVVTKKKAPLTHSITANLMYRF